MTSINAQTTPGILWPHLASLGTSQINGVSTGDTFGILRFSVPSRSIVEICQGLPFHPVFSLALALTPGFTSGLDVPRMLMY